MINSPMAYFISALLGGNCQEAVTEARRLHQSGVELESIVTGGIEAAMGELDVKCTLEEFNLLEIMLVGRAVMEVMKSFYSSEQLAPCARGTVILASPEGDVHDLGKNILRMILTGKGYRVVDLGVDCPISKLVEAAAQEKPQAIGLSALITQVIPTVRQAKDQLNARGLGHIKVLAGGAALKQARAEQLNVDYVAQSAFDGGHYLDRLTKEMLGA